MPGTVDLTTFINVVIPAAELVEVILPPGVVYPPGSGGSYYNYSEVEVVAAIDGATTISLPALPVPISIFSFYINGLRQNNSEATLAGLIVDLPVGLSIVTGDNINLIYSHL